MYLIEQRSAFDKVRVALEKRRPMKDLIDFKIQALAVLVLCLAQKGMQEGWGKQTGAPVETAHWLIYLFIY
jgi:hypothetical protein